MNAELKTGLLAGFLCLLQSCVSAPQTASLVAQFPAIAVAHEIENVKFFPQEDYYCGPTTLAEVLHFYGIEVAPEEVAPSLFTPDLQGTLQIEMVASARQFGLLSYVDRGNLVQLLSLISDDIPVIVLQNLGTSWFPYWHYALVIGYDLDAEKILLHTGTTQRRVAPMDLFESTWRKGDYWFLAALPPQRHSDYMDSLIYISAAQDLLDTGQADAGEQALMTATGQWPDYWLSYFLLGNFYLAENPALALAWYKKGLPGGKDNVSYLNNTAYALHGNGCVDEAIDLLKLALTFAPDNSTLKDSLTELSGKPITNSQTKVQIEVCSI